MKCYSYTVVTKSFFIKYFILSRTLWDTQWQFKKIVSLNFTEIVVVTFRNKSVHLWPFFFIIKNDKFVFFDTDFFYLKCFSNFNKRYVYNMKLGINDCKFRYGEFFSLVIEDYLLHQKLHFMLTRELNSGPQAQPSRLQSRNQYLFLI